VLLCAGTFVDGPCDLSLFRFKARTGGATPVTTQIRIVSDPDRTFVDAGIYVSPADPVRPRQVTFQDATVVVYSPLTQVPAPPAASGSDFNLDHRPNPARSGGHFRVSLPRPGDFRLDVFDLAGRRVFSETGHADFAGDREISWEGADPAGRPLPGGIYFARAGSGTESTTTKVILAP
jgi:hypothetical protein